MAGSGGHYLQAGRQPFWLPALFDNPEYCPFAGGSVFYVPVNTQIFRVF